MSPYFFRPEKFLVPPFSVLNARTGWWQEPKRSWISPGIQSESGRDSELLFNKSSQSGAVYDRKNTDEAKIGTTILLCRIIAMNVRHRLKP